MVGIAPSADFQAAAHPAKFLLGVGSAFRSANFALAKPYRPVRENDEFGLFNDFFRNDDGGCGNRFAFHLN